MSVIKIALGIILAVILLAAGCAVMVGGAADTESSNEPRAKVETKAKADRPAKVEPTEKETEDAPTETAGEANARAAAEGYISMAPFSRKGLIEQLEFEGYSTKDATYGVDALRANWNEQAAKAAKGYLDMTAFSRTGLIEQLEFEGYTTQQATHGVNAAGL